MSALTRIWTLSRSKCSHLSILSSSRNISTSKKKQETATLTPTVAGTATKAEEKNWMSYGFNHHDKDEDRHFMHVLTFMGISVIFVFGGMLLAYRPDDLCRDWAQREGYLELRRREKLGLPLVDPNYIPLDKIKLPTDEELGDTEIVI
uniref:NADH dehydrogenase [ubiquinone] 1 beta subcomplex subunit 11, mitochondrial n=1 Tax=Lygus hesperus TaxID=30085 RepID=A0A0A9WSU8_LYGHE